jgi:hypothetical protein
MLKNKVFQKLVKRKVQVLEIYEDSKNSNMADFKEKPRHGNIFPLNMILKNARRSKITIFLMS